MQSQTNVLNYWYLLIAMAQHMRLIVLSFLARSLIVLIMADENTVAWFLTPNAVLEVVLQLAMYEEEQ
jgi:hypothetical protein